MQHSGLYSFFNSGKNGNDQSPWRFFMIVVVVFGIGVRLYHFLDNRSLWEDELFLASGLIRMNFAELATQPLDYLQRAPLGFLWGSRFFVVLFGDHEMPLRLFPLICSFGALIGFVPLARHFLKPFGTFIAVSILALAPPLIYHSTEAKQYSTELLATILSLLLYIRYHDRQDMRSLLKWGIGGAAILGFSFSALFILGGIGMHACIELILRKKWKALTGMLLPVALWMAGFGLAYLFSIAHYSDSGWLQDFWSRRNAFFPRPPEFMAELKWLVHYFYTLVYYPLGLSWFELDYERSYSILHRVMMRMPFIPLALLGAGFVLMLQKARERWALLTCPFLLALLASSFSFYPLHERLNVFLAPLFILLIAYACDRLHDLPRRRWAGIAIAFLLLAAPVMNTGMGLTRTDRFGGYKKSWQREALMHLKKHFRPGDMVYIYWNDLPGWRYYKTAYHLDFPAVEGMDVRLISAGFEDYYRNLSPDFEAMRQYKRTWLVHRNYNLMKTGDFEGRPEWYYKDVDAVRMLHRKLDEMGRETEVFEPGHGRRSDVHVGVYEWIR